MLFLKEEELLKACFVTRINPPLDAGVELYIIFNVKRVGPLRLTSVKPSIHSTNASMGQMDTYTRPLNLVPCLST